MITENELEPSIAGVEKWQISDYKVKALVSLVYSAVSQVKLSVQLHEDKVN